MHARLDRRRAQLLTRTGLDWTHKYRAIAAALSVLPAKQAYLDGELCGVRSDGKTSFSLIQTASDSRNSDHLVFFLFDLLYLDGEMVNAAPLHERKEQLRDLLSNAGTPLQYSDHQIGQGAEFYVRACEMSLEGIISKPVEAPYSRGNRGLWVKVKCQNRAEFVVVGWTDPAGARHLRGFEAAAAAGIGKVIFISTTSVYRPNTRYGSSKILAELIAEDYRKHRHMNVVTLRPRGFIPYWDRTCIPNTATGRAGSGRGRCISTMLPQP